jgi:hypothetical protein
MAVLQLFHISNLQGQISPTDFYWGLEQMTCGDGLLYVPVSMGVFLLVLHDWHVGVFQGSSHPVDAYGPSIAPYQDSKTCWPWAWSKWDRWNISRWPFSPMPCLPTPRYQSSRWMGWCPPPRSVHIESLWVVDINCACSI